MKTCNKCNVPKDETEFYRYSKTNGLRPLCKVCHKAECTARAKADPKGTNERTKAWRAAHPDRASEISRAWQLRHPEQSKNISIKGLYNIDFDALWDAQKGLCACCGEAMVRSGRTKMSVCVDHDRSCCPGKKSCGKCVRGMIHWRCNLMLGYSSDEPKLLRAAADYVEQWQQRRPISESVYTHG